MVFGHPILQGDLLRVISVRVHASLYRPDFTGRIQTAGFHEKSHFRAKLVIKLLIFRAALRDIISSADLSSSSPGAATFSRAARFSTLMSGGLFIRFTFMRGTPSGTVAPFLIFLPLNIPAMNFLAAAIFPGAHTASGWPSTAASFSPCRFSRKNFRTQSLRLRRAGRRIFLTLFLREKDGFCSKYARARFFAMSAADCGARIENAMALSG
jgi:hypothetical protein